MKEYRLAYGETGVRFRLPKDADVFVVEPEDREGIADQAGAVQRALRRPVNLKPLKDLVRATDRVGIIFSDNTRPTPNHILIPQICSELDHLSDSQILLFNSTGTHRANTEAELVQMLGRSIIDRFRIIQNDAQDEESHVLVGTTKNGNDIWINREFVECDVRIATGFIEPHLFAGYSGGGKAILPGLATLGSISRNHSPGNIHHPAAQWGITSENPVWEEISEVAKMLAPIFLLNVSLNRDQQIDQVFAGELSEAHAAGCEHVKRTSLVPVSRSFDIVVGNNSGYPQDRNLYQAVKGMSAAAQVVKQGGSIVVGAECRDGIPDHGCYGQLLSQAKSPEDLLLKISAPGFHSLDMWQAQIHAQICLKADVTLYSHILTDDEIKRTFIRPCASIDQALAEIIERHGSSPSICVIPYGLMAIPYLA
jgi:nickel-dependent lactate racemase